VGRKHENVGRMHENVGRKLENVDENVGSYLDNRSHFPINCIHHIISPVLNVSTIMEGECEMEESTLSIAGSKTGLRSLVKELA
jgi:hypothetical protein